MSRILFLELELLANLSYYTHLQKPVLSRTQYLNKIQKKHPIVDICKYKTCAKFQQKILNSMVFGACQSFQFFRQITEFLGNNRSLSKFKNWILHHVISIIKFQNK